MGEYKSIDEESVVRNKLKVKCLNCGKPLKWNKGAHIDYYTCRTMTMSCQFFSKMPVKAAEKLAKLQKLEERLEKL